MTKSELVTTVAKETELTKDVAQKCVELIFDTIKDTMVKGDKISITGFGTFERRDRKQRECINPQTKEKMIVVAKKVPAFKAGKQLKEQVINAPTISD